MKLATTFCLLLLQLFSFSFAQGEGNHWYFGINAGIDFNGGAPTAVTNGALSTIEGCASISTSAGVLLFYTDGITVYNSTHSVMSNGTGLQGNSSSSQSAIIVQKPGSASTYVIYTVDDVGGPAGMRYSEVDMTQLGGLGAVTAVKNVPIVNPVCEKVTAVKHQNGLDFWIVTHLYNSNTFHSYLLTSAGLNMTPVVANMGISITSSSASIGYIKSSPDGARIAVANRADDNVELYDFNNSTGVLSNIRVLSSNGSPNGPYGVEFSLNSNLLYVSESNSGSSNVYQYDLLAGPTTAIIASRITIGTQQGWGGTIQMAPDSKIYHARYQDTYLGVIANPDVLGMGCAYSAQGIYLAGQNSTVGLPTFYNTIVLNPSTILSSNYCFGDSTLFEMTTLSPPDSLIWNFDDPASGVFNTAIDTMPSHVFSDTGTYNISLVTYTMGSVDSSNHLVYINPLPVVDLGADTVLCLGQTVTLDAGNPGGTYLWNDNSTNATLLVNQAGTYSVEVTLNGCSAIDSIAVIYDSLASVDLGPDQTVCVGQNVLLDATSPYPGATYLWQDNSTNATFNTTLPGTYWVEVSNYCGSVSDTVEILNMDVPVVDLGSDTTLCPNTTLLLDATYPSSTYVWQDNSTNATFNVVQAGTYDVAVTNTCGTTYDTIVIDYDVLPIVNLGPDTLICANDSILLDATFANSSYIWQDNSTNSTFLVTQVGTYTVDVTNYCGTTTDDIVVTNLAPPIVDLGNDTTVCIGTAVLLDATYPSSTYVWQDGALTPTYSATLTDTYTVTVTNMCGSFTDSIDIEFYSSITVNLGLDTIVCDSDSFTLNANFPSGSVVWQDNSTGQSYTVTSPGTYIATASIGTCVDIDTIVVDFNYSPYLDLGSDIYTCGEEMVLIAPEPVQEGAYSWSNGSSETTIHVNEFDTYTLTITNYCGTTTDEIEIGDLNCDCMVFFPNSFTPDADEYNNTFESSHDCIFDKYELRIFNRWGELIFESFDSNQGWDATYNGHFVQTGTYVYTFLYQTKYGIEKTLNGHVNVIR